MADCAAQVLLDLRLRSKTVGNEATQVVRVLGRVGDHMADAPEIFDQTPRLRAITPLARRDREPDQ